MWKWLKRIMITNDQTDDCRWVIEPFLDDSIDKLLEFYQKEGGSLNSPRLLECTVVLPSLEQISNFRNALPDSWSSQVRKWSEEDHWLCACTKLVCPTHQEIKDQTKVLCVHSLSQHPVLWYYLGLYSGDRNRRVEITPSILDYR